MPTPIHFQHKSGAVTYRIKGEVSEGNEVDISLVLVDDDGQALGGGDLRFPLQRARGVREALTNVLRNCVEAIDPVKAYTVDEKRQTDPKAYGRWTPEEESVLADLYRSGASPEEITRQLGRGLGAIATRLERLGLIPDRTTYAQTD